MLIPFPSPQSIATARAVMLSERAQVTAQVGLKFVLIRCPHCAYEADGTGVNEDQAERHAVSAIVAHVMRVHAES